MSRLTCTQCESMLLDAADGLLLPDDQTHFDLHLAECPACTRLFADIRRGGAWMEMLKEAPPVPPEGLVDRILARTSGDPETSRQRAGAGRPCGVAVRAQPGKGAARSVCRRTCSSPVPGCSA